MIVKLKMPQVAAEKLFDLLTHEPELLEGFDLVELYLGDIEYITLEKYFEKSMHETEQINIQFLQDWLVNSDNKILQEYRRKLSNYDLHEKQRILTLEHLTDELVTLYLEHPVDQITRIKIKRLEEKHQEIIEILNELNKQKLELAMEIIQKYKPNINQTELFAEASNLVPILDMLLQNPLLPNTDIEDSQIMKERRKLE